MPAGFLKVRPATGRSVFLVHTVVLIAATVTQVTSAQTMYHTTDAVSGCLVHPVVSIPILWD